MDMLMLLNLSIEFSGIGLSVLGLFYVLLNTRIDRRTARTFLLFFSCLILFTASNVAGQLMRGQPGPAWHAALLASNFLEFSLPVLLAGIMTRYLLSILDPGGEKKAVRIAAAILLCLHFALLIVSQFTGLFYTIDSANVYHRSRGYPLSFLMGALLLLLDMALLIRGRDRLSRKERIAFWIYFALPLAAMAVQLFVYGLYLVVFSGIFAALALFVFILDGQTERYLRQERQLADMRVNLLLSQIRPHFIYNTLTSIYVLCRDDPPRAMEVIQDFSAYLQSNFDAVAATDLIIFADELRHVQAYLAVESIRYGNKLTVEYDTQHTAFRLPALTLQPLVENAVKYGVGRGHAPEHIVIRSRAEGDCAVLTVEDDGPGFDPELQDDGVHVGIRNVRERLARMCSGTLDIRSSPVCGTVVTVTIPNRGGAI